MRDGVPPMCLPASKKIKLKSWSRGKKNKELLFTKDLL
jgi:hypothetical protein